MSENLREIARQLHEAQGKHNDVLLAIAGSCIALSVHRTAGVYPIWPMILLAVAVLCWAGSILAGVRNRLYFQSILYANFSLLKVQAGEEPECGRHPALIDAASSGIMKAIDYNNDKASHYAKAQLTLLLIGAGFFMIWHVIDMFLTTPVKVS
jgi:hypothetical protein